MRSRAFELVNYLIATVWHNEDGIACYPFSQSHLLRWLAEKHSTAALPLHSSTCSHGARARIYSRRLRKVYTTFDSPALEVLPTVVGLQVKPFISDELALSALAAL